MSRKSVKTNREIERAAQLLADIFFELVTNKHEAKNIKKLKANKHNYERTTKRY